MWAASTPTNVLLCQAELHGIHKLEKIQKGSWMCEFYSNKYNQMPRKPDPKPPQSKKRDFTGEYLSAIVNSGTVHEITSGGIQKHFNDFAKTHHRQRLRGPQLYEIVRILMGVETRRCFEENHLDGFKELKQWVLAVDIDGIKERLQRMELYNAEITL